MWQHYVVVWLGSGVMVLSVAYLNPHLPSAERASGQADTERLASFH